MERPDIGGFTNEQLERQVIPIPGIATKPHEVKPHEKGAEVKLDSPENQKLLQDMYGTWAEDVEIVTCVSGGTKLVVSDFPVFKIFMATIIRQGVNVVNVCENMEWTGMHARLHQYVAYLKNETAKNDAMGGGMRQRKLYMVVDGMDVFFNDVGPVLDQENVDNFAQYLRKKYDEIRGDKKIVISSERICGWGGAHLCTEKDEARYPAAPPS